VWGIFHGDRDSQIAKQFSTSMDECLKQVGYDSQAPATFVVKDAHRADSWKRELKARLNPNVQAIVLLLPGSKGRPNSYDEVKK
jgi:hypothetical protein